MPGMDEARDRAAVKPAHRPYPPPAIDRVRALIRIEKVYTELLSAVTELAEIERAIIKAGGIPRPTVIPEQVEAVLGPHIARACGKKFR